MGRRGKAEPIELHRALALYLEEGRSQGFAPGTTDLQKRMLTRFAGVCREVGSEKGLAVLMVHHLDPVYISRYFGEIQDTSQANRNNALWCVGGFVRYMERLGYLRPGGAHWLIGDRKIRKANRQPKYYIPVEQFRPMTVAAGERHPCDRITLSLAFYTLGRQSEISGIRLKNLDLDAGLIRIWRSKRHRWTEVTICPPLARDLDLWLAYYAESTGYGSPRELVAARPDWYLAPRVTITRNKGEFNSKLMEYGFDPALRAINLQYLLKRMLDIFGAQTEDGLRVRHVGEGMHTVRRSGARCMLDYLTDVVGADKALLQVAAILDHDDPRQTLLYIGRDIERHRLNAWLETHSPYGDDEDPGMGNVTRMPLRGPRSHAAASGRFGRTDVPGEVDAL